jgi:hypothetical protein
MPARLEKICIILSYLVILALDLLGCFSIVPASLGAMTVYEGLGVASAAAAAGQATTSNAQRLPQIPLDVEQYPVAPCGLELKQVHVFVRHGTSLQLLLFQYGILAAQSPRPDLISTDGRSVFWLDLQTPYSITNLVFSSPLLSAPLSSVASLKNFTHGSHVGKVNVPPSESECVTLPRLSRNTG